jgi:peptide/nickel transport system permease protein
VLQGIGTTLVLASAAVLLSSTAAAMLGLLAAFHGGAVDQLLVRVADVLFAFPAIILALLMIAIFGPGLAGVIIAIVLVTLPLMFRVVRAAAINVRGRDFVTSARVSGASEFRILSVHFVPNVSGPIVVQMTYALSIGMIVESGLSFLGLGVQVPNASLGSLIHNGVTYLVIAPWMVFVPGLILAAAILSINLLGDGLRDALDPRLPRTLT